MNNVRTFFLASCAVILCVLCIPSNTYAAADADNPYTRWISGIPENDNMTVSPAQPSPGQQVTLTLEGSPNGLSANQPFLIVDTSSLNQPSSYIVLQGTESSSTKNSAVYTLTIPPNLVQGDTYDIITAQIGKDLTVFRGQVTVTAVPGHQLPEVPFAALFPLLLIGGFMVFYFRKRSLSLGK